MSIAATIRIVLSLVLLLAAAGFAASSEPPFAPVRPAVDGWSGFVQPNNDPRQAAREFTFDGEDGRWETYWDLLTGTGSAVYQLRHVSIVPNSESISIDSSRALRGRDYYINYETGQIAFHRSIPPRSTISVSYRYLPSKQRDGVAGALGVVPLRFGEAVSMNLLGSYVMGQPGSSFDFSIFGLDTDIRPADGLSLRSAFFVSRPVLDKSRSRTRGLPMMAFNGERPSGGEDPTPGNFLLQDVSYESGPFHLKAMLQDIDQEFAGFAALRGRGGFGKDELAILEREKGLRRKSYELSWAPSDSLSLAAGLNQIKQGGEEEILRRTLEFKSGFLSIASEFRSVSPGFNRFGSLRESDQAGQWAKERGLDRKSIAASLVPWEDAKVTYDLVQSSDKPSGGEEINSIKRRRVQFDSKWISAFSTYQKVDEGFTRSKDLQLPYSKQLDEMRGQTLKDFGATIDPAKWLTYSMYNKKLRNGPAAFDLTQKVQDLDFHFNGGKTHLNLVRDNTGIEHDSAAEQGMRRRATTFDQANLFGWLGISVLKEKTDLAGFDTPLDKRTKSEFSISCDQNRRTRLWGNYKYSRNEHDIRDGAQDFQFATKLGDRLSLNARTFGIRSTAKGDSYTNAGVLEYLAPGGQKFSFERFVSDVERQGVYRGRSIAFDGPLTGKLHLVGSHKVVDFEPNPESGMPTDSVVTKSLGLRGDFGKTKVQLGIMRIHNDEKRQQLAKNCRIETQLFHHALEFEYVGNSDSSEVFSGWRSWKIASDPDPQKRLHYDLLYKAKDFPDGKRVHMRDYNINYKLGDRFTLKGMYRKNGEQPNGRVIELWEKSLGISWKLRRHWALSLNYGHKKPPNAPQTLTSKMALTRDLGAKDRIKVSYDIDYLKREYGRKEIVYGLEYDRMVNADHFITLSAKYYDRSDTNPDSDPKNEVVGRLDFKFTFN